MSNAASALMTGNPPSDIGPNAQNVEIIDRIVGGLRWTATTETITRNLLLFAFLSFAVIVLKYYRTVLRDLQGAEARLAWVDAGQVALAYAQATGSRKIFGAALRSYMKSNSPADNKEEFSEEDDKIYGILARVLKSFDK